MDVGLEIIAMSQKGESESEMKKKSLYLVFTSTQERNMVFDALLKIVPQDCVTT